MSDVWSNARHNAEPECSKCRGAGTYMYDHNHGKICELCCKHNMGWWQLTEGFANPGWWCCLAGCGFSVPERPAE